MDQETGAQPPSAGASPPTPAGVLVPAAALATLAAASLGGPFATAAALAFVLVPWTIGARRSGESRLTAAVAAGSAAAFCGAAAAWGIGALPVVMLGVVAALFVGRIGAVEIGKRDVHQTTDLLAAGAFGAAVWGLLSAHLILVRSTDRFGLRGTLAFLAAAAAFHLGRMVAVVVRARRRRPGHATAAQDAPPPPGPDAITIAPGVLLAALAGLAAGALAAPPFTLTSGAFVGALVGAAVAVGDAAWAALQSSSNPAAGPAWHRRIAIRPEGILFAAPFFYWTFRTLVI